MKNLFLKMVEMYNLDPSGINQKSFYGKAKIVKYENEDLYLTCLYSYNALIAVIDNDCNLHLTEKFNASITTAKHLRSFLNRHNLGSLEFKDLKEIYKSSNEQINKFVNLGIKR